VPRWTGPPGWCHRGRRAPVIRVLLVDDQHLIRAGLRMLCETQPDIEVVGEADDGRDAIAPGHPAGA
jgi:hypothetical protein